MDIDDIIDELVLRADSDEEKFASLNMFCKKNKISKRDAISKFLLRGLNNLFLERGLNNPFVC